MFSLSHPASPRKEGRKEQRKQEQALALSHAAPAARNAAETGVEMQSWELCACGVCLHTRVSHRRTRGDACSCTLCILQPAPARVPVSGEVLGALQGLRRVHSTDIWKDGDDPAGKGLGVLCTGLQLLINQYSY